MGLPFYSRDIRTGEWQPYEDLVRDNPLSPSIDQIGTAYFNGPDLISKKTNLALNSNFAGVMIWEIGQDHFDNTVQALASDALSPVITNVILTHGRSDSPDHQALKSAGSGADLGNRDEL